MNFHPAATPTLQNAQKFFTEIFADNLVGIYLHGSLVSNCFNPNLSDIDFVVVIKHPLTMPQRRKIIDFSIELDKNAPGKGIEYSIVTRRQIDHFAHPTPNELTFSYHSLDHHTREELYTLSQPPDPDLAAHFTVILDRGITLVGESTEEVFKPVPKEAFLEALISDAQYIKGMITKKPFYGVLNLCRIYAFKSEGRLLSKKEGGLWALNHPTVGRHYNPLIRKALRDYRTEMSTNWDNDQLLAFFDDMYARIKGRENT